MDDPPGPNLHRRLAIEAHKHAAFKDNVVADHLYQVRQERPAARETDPGRDTPRCREFSFEEEAARMPNQPKNVGGGSVMVQISEFERLVLSSGRAILYARQYCDSHQASPVQEKLDLLEESLGGGLMLQK
jgi:hypothetical protein